MWFDSEPNINTLQVYISKVLQLKNVAAQSTMTITDSQTHINDISANKATVNMSSPHE